MQLRAFAERAWSLALLSSSGQFSTQFKFMQSTSLARRATRDVREEKGKAVKTTDCAGLCPAKSKQAKTNAADDVTVTPGNEESSTKETNPARRLAKTISIWRLSVVAQIEWPRNYNSYRNDVRLSHVTRAWLPEHPISGVAMTSLIEAAATSEVRRWVAVASVRKLIAHMTLRDGRQWVSKRSCSRGTKCSFKHDEQKRTKR